VETLGTGCLLLDSVLEIFVGGYSICVRLKVFG
jgi:hypothetical protein